MKARERSMDGRDRGRCGAIGIMRGKRTKNRRLRQIRAEKRGN